jgi:hypothetical protein
MDGVGLDEMRRETAITWPKPLAQLITVLCKDNGVHCSDDMALPP